MKYCKYHDLFFCPTHEGQCLADDCVLKPQLPGVEGSRCAICYGRIEPKALREQRQSE